MMSIDVHDVIMNYYSEPSPSYPFSGKLYVSGFGRCLRSTMSRILDLPQGQFPAHVREVMDLGGLYEDTTLKALRKIHGQGIETQTRVGNDIWSGKLDFLVMRPDDAPIIIEHKATGDKWFDYQNSLPKFDHVCQLWLYGQLWLEKHGVLPELILFYRSWGCWAQFEMIEEQGRLLFRGEVNGVPADRVIECDMGERRDQFESAYRDLMRMRREGISNADRLEYWKSIHVTMSDDQGCTFRGQPSCPQYRECWGRE